MAIREAARRRFPVAMRQTWRQGSGRGEVCSGISAYKNSPARRGCRFGREPPVGVEPTTGRFTKLAALPIEFGGGGLDIQDGLYHKSERVQGAKPQSDLWSFALSKQLPYSGLQELWPFPSPVCPFAALAGTFLGGGRGEKFGLLEGAAGKYPKPASDEAKKNKKKAFFIAAAKPPQ